MYKTIITSAFEKDIKLAEKQGKNIKLLAAVLNDLEMGKTLSEKHKNHKLKNIDPVTWDCHITPDWILLYEINKKNETLKLKRIGSHSEIFR
jgi:mRNA interferase YafQ